MYTLLIRKKVLKIKVKEKNKHKEDGKKIWDKTNNIIIPLSKLIEHLHIMDC